MKNSYQRINKKHLKNVFAAHQKNIAYKRVPDVFIPFPYAAQNQKKKSGGNRISDANNRLMRDTLLFKTG